MNEGEIGKIYSDGEIIFKEGDIGDVMYVVQSGQVDIIKNTPSGRIKIATLGSGDIFGEMAMFDKLPRSATAVVSGSARILTIDKKKLFSSINSDPTVVMKILESMSRRIRNINEEITKLKKDNKNILHMFVDIDEICKLILNEAKNIVNADNGSVMLLGDDQNRLIIKSAFGTEWEPKTELRLGEGIAGDVVKSGKAEMINNVSYDPRFKQGESIIRAILCVPLKWKNKVFGVINMSTSSEKMFTLGDLKTLHSISIYASVAIENAKNFLKLKDLTDSVIRHVTLLGVW